MPRKPNEKKADPPPVVAAGGGNKLWYGESMIAHYNPDTHLVTIRNRHGAIMGRCEEINGGFEFVRERFYSHEITPEQWQEIEAELARLNK